jgi:hypothetical protein
MRKLLLFLMFSCFSLYASSSKELDAQLHLACQTGDVDTVRALVIAGANIEALDDQGNAPLVVASSQDYIDVVKVLVASGAKKNGLLNVGLSQDLILFFHWYTPEIIAKEKTLFGQLVKEAFDEYKEGRPELLARMLSGVGKNGQKFLPDSVIQSVKDLFEINDLECNKIPDLRNKVPGLQINGLLQIASRSQAYLHRAKMRMPSISDLRIDE